MAVNKDKENKAKEEMELLLSEKEIKINTKNFIVKKISMLNSIRLASKLGQYIQSIMSDSDAISSAISKITFVDKDNPQNTTSIRVLGFIEMLALIGDDGADFISDLIVKSTNMNIMDVEEITLEDSIDIVEDIYEVNKGFFKKFGKKLEARLPKAKAKENQKATNEQ